MHGAKKSITVRHVVACELKLFFEVSDPTKKKRANIKRSPKQQMALTPLQPSPSWRRLSSLSPTSERCRLFRPVRVFGELWDVCRLCIIHVSREIKSFVQRLSFGGERKKAAAAEYRATPPSVCVLFSSMHHKELTAQQGNREIENLDPGILRRNVYT